MRQKLTLVNFSLYTQSTMTWFERYVRAVARMLRIIGKEVEVVSLGCGPLDWPIAQLPQVKKMILVDNQPEVAEILSYLIGGSKNRIHLAVLEWLCRNERNKSNTDLSDLPHIQAALERLQSVRALPVGWDYESIITNGIWMPDNLAQRIEFVNQDLERFLLKSKGSLVGKMPIFGNVITQLTKLVNRPQEMADFYSQILQAFGENMVGFIQTMGPHFDDQTTVNKKTQDWPPLLEQLSKAGLRPEAFLRSDMVLNGGKFLGSVDIFLGVKMEFALDKLAELFNNIWGTFLAPTIMEISTWKEVQMDPDKVLLVGQRLDGNNWQLLTILKTLLLRLLTEDGYASKRKYGRNIMTLGEVYVER